MDWEKYEREHPLYYLPDENGEPVPTDCPTWAHWFESTHDGAGGKGRIIARTEVGGYEVSTIFMGLDHGYDGGKPVLWETLAFSDGVSVEDTMQRYTSRAAALKGHKRAVAICERRMQEAEARVRKR